MVRTQRAHGRQRQVGAAPRLEGAELEHERAREPKAPAGSLEAGRRQGQRTADGPGRIR